MLNFQVLLSLKHEGRPTGLPYSEGVESILNEDIYLLKEPKVSVKVLIHISIHDSSGPENKTAEHILEQKTPRCCSML